MNEKHVRKNGGVRCCEEVIWKTETPFSCPCCGGSKLYKDELRALNDGSQGQRWLCQNCGRRFSWGNSSNTAMWASSNSQVCAKEKAKNLAETPGQETAQRESTSADSFKGKIIEHTMWLQRKATENQR